MTQRGQLPERLGSRARSRSSLLLLGTVLAAGAIAPAVGLAAGLGGSSNSVGAGTTAVSSCDGNGVSVIQNLSGANVVSVTVGGIAAACGGATMNLAVNNGTANSSGSGTVPGGGGSLTITLAVAVPAKDVEQIDLTIAGP